MAVVVHGRVVTQVRQTQVQCRYAGNLGRDPPPRRVKSAAEAGAAEQGRGRQWQCEQVSSVPGAVSQRDSSSSRCSAAGRCSAVRV